MVPFELLIQKQNELLQEQNALLAQIAKNQLKTVATPAISCTSNKVTITCSTSGAAIYYTTDGTEPTKESTAYSAPVDITVTTTFKAIACALDMHDSAVASAVCEYVAPEATE